MYKNSKKKKSWLTKAQKKQSVPPIPSPPKKKKTRHQGSTSSPARRKLPLKCATGLGKKQQAQHTALTMVVDIQFIGIVTVILHQLLISWTCTIGKHLKSTVLHFVVPQKIGTVVCLSFHLVWVVIEHICQRDQKFLATHGQRSGSDDAFGPQIIRKSRFS